MCAFRWSISRTVKGTDGLTAFQRAFSASVSSTNHARSMEREDLVLGGKEEEGSDLGQIFWTVFSLASRKVLRSS